MTTQQYSDDEIDLRDYIKVVIKRKKIVLSIFFICVITVTIMSFLMPKVYEVNATIRIGSFRNAVSPKDNNILISKPEAIQILQSKRIFNYTPQGLSTDISGVKIKGEDVEGTDFVRLNVQGFDPDLVAKACKALVNSFISEGKKIYGAKYALLNKQIQELEKRKKVTEEETKKLSQKISTQTSNPDSPLLQNALARYENIYNDLSQQTYVLREKLTNFKEFEVFEPPSIPTSLRSKKKVNIAISAILGLMLGVFVAFFIEFWQKRVK